jgi:hypothetical protein
MNDAIPKVSDKRTGRLPVAVVIRFVSHTFEESYRSRIVI